MTPTVRTFRAPDTASALAAVKAALGADAVILSTRTVDGGLFRRPEVEITAALEAPPTPRPAPRRRPPPPPRDEGVDLAPTPRPPPPPAPRPADDALQDELRQLRR